MNKIIKEIVMVPLLAALYAPVQAEPLSPARFHRPRMEAHLTLDNIAGKQVSSSQRLRRGTEYIHCRFPQQEDRKYIHCSFPGRDEKKYIHCTFPPKEEDTGYIHCRFDDE